MPCVGITAAWRFRLLIQERTHLPRPRGMLELTQSLRLDLPDTLTGDAELLSDFFQRVISVHADAEAHAQHALLARSERREDASDGFLKIGLDRGVDGDHRILVLDEVTKVAVLLVANRRFKADRFLG